MNRVFVDTSALLALMNAEDHLHGRAVEAANALRSTGAGLVTTSYVMVETYALLDRRLGREDLHQQVAIRVVSGPSERRDGAGDSPLPPAAARGRSLGREPNPANPRRTVTNSASASLSSAALP